MIRAGGRFAAPVNSAHAAAHATVIPAHAGIHSLFPTLTVPGARRGDALQIA